MYGLYPMIYVQRNWFHQVWTYCVFPRPLVFREPGQEHMLCWHDSFHKSFGTSFLKTWSQIFVMEEEYRMQKKKKQSDIQQVLSATSTNGFPHSSGFDTGTAVIHDGTVTNPEPSISPSPTLQPVSIADARRNSFSRPNNHNFDTLCERSCPGRRGS